MDALIQGGAPRPPVPAKSVAKASGERAKPVADGQEVLRMVPIGQIVPNTRQPRRTFKPEALKELADSIQAKGVLQPVLVRQAGDKFELIAGERRFRAAQVAGLSELPVRLQVVDDLGALESALIENIQREDLNLMEEAEGYRALMNLAGLTQEEVARRVGKARATVANTLRLLDLPEAIQRLLADGQLSAGHAKVLLGVDPAVRQGLAARVVAQGLSVRALEQLVAGLATGDPRRKTSEPKTPSGGASQDQGAKHLKFLADRMQQELGTKVMLTPARVGPDGKREMGRIIIEYFDNEDLSRLLETLNLGDLA